MPYSDGSTTWPSTLDGSTPPKVGKRYGPRFEGNVVGVTQAESGEGRIVFEFDGKDGSALFAQSFSIPPKRRIPGGTDIPSYALVTNAYIEVDGVFTSGTVDIDVDGSPINTAPEVLSALGFSDMPLGAIEPIDSTNVITVSNPTAAVAAAAGSYAKVIVEFTRV
jgi:hypothetical protein